jgi:hypothetical protein
MDLVHMDQTRANLQSARHSPDTTLDTILDTDTRPHPVPERTDDLFVDFHAVTGRIKQSALSRRPP